MSRVLKRKPCLWPLFLFFWSFFKASTAPRQYSMSQMKPQKVSIKSACRSTRHSLISSNWKTTYLLFLCLFIFRYTRLIVNLIAFLCYSPTKSVFPTTSETKIYYTCKDVTVIVPTTNPYNATTREVVERILRNNPAAVIVATIGKQRNHKLLDERFGSQRVSVVRVPKPNKRRQICMAVRKVTPWNEACSIYDLRCVQSIDTLLLLLLRLTMP